MPPAKTLTERAEERTSPEPILEIPPGYERWIRYGANWTQLISPYMILYVVLIFAIGGVSIGSTNLGATLDLAGKSPLVFGTTVMLDGLFHVLVFVTAVTLFAALRQRWPVRASLLLVFGTWQMLMGFTKGLSSWFTFTHLGAAYVSGDELLRSTLLPVAAAEYGLRDALQWMDSLGVLAIWVSVSLLPSSAGLPRAVRWLGWIMAVAILSPDPAFLLVVLLSPPWLFLLGRWLKRLPVAAWKPLKERR
jgi:hypothetical protein